jgi:hypothetical protein
MQDGPTVGADLPEGMRERAAVAGAVAPPGVKGWVPAVSESACGS